MNTLEPCTLREMLISKEKNCKHCFVMKLWPTRQLVKSRNLLRKERMIQRMAWTSSREAVKNGWSHCCDWKERLYFDQECWQSLKIGTFVQTKLLLSACMNHWSRKLIHLKCESILFALKPGLFRNKSRDVWFQHCQRKTSLSQMMTTKKGCCS